MKKKLLNLTLVLALTVSLIAPSNVYANTSKELTTAKATTTTPTPTSAPQEKEEIEHGNTKFADIKYTRPDFKSVRTTIKSVVPLLKKKNQDKKIRKLLEQIDDAMSDADTMSTYLNIQTTHDVTDQKTAEEQTYINSQITSIYSLYCKLCVKILESNYGYILRNDLTQEEIDDIYEATKRITPELIKLQSKAEELTAEYRKAMSTTTVKVNGVDMTETDLYNSTTLTPEELNSYNAELLKNLNQTTASIYLEITKVYKEMAKMNGFDNVTDYMYDSYDRDYSAKQVKNFSAYVKKYIIPLFIEISSTWTQEEIDLVTSTRSDLKQIEPYINDYFLEVSYDMNQAFNYMKDLGLYSMDATPVKQDLNYTTYLSGIEEPYLSLYTTGDPMDVSTYVHEFGHYNAFYLNGSSLGSNMDICEIHSQANEFLFLPYYSKVFGKADKSIAKYQILQNLGVIIDGCIFDEFQQYVYSHNLTTVEELNKAFFNIMCEYGFADPNSDNPQDLNWVKVPHTFEVPLYYISYAMSAVPSLEIFTDSLSDRAGAIDTYNKVVNYGTDYSFLKLLKKTGLNSPFKETTYSTLVDALYNYFGLNTQEAKPAA